MKSKGLTRKLVRRTATVTVIIFLIALLILGLALFSQVKANMNDNMRLNAEAIAQQSDEFFNIHKTITGQYSQDPVLKEYMTEIKNSKGWLDENSMWPTIYSQIKGSYDLYKDTVVELYIASYYVQDIASSTGDVMNKDYPGAVDTFHREWMVRPMEEKQTIITSPYVDGQTGDVVCTIASPIYSGEGTFLGSAAISFMLNDVQDIFANAKIGEEGYVMAFLNDGTFFYHPDEKYLAADSGGKVGKITDFDFSQELTEAVLNGDEGEIVSFTDENGRNMLAVTEVLETTGWRVLVCLPTSEAYAMAINTIILQVVILALALIGIIAAIFIVTRKAVLPVSNIANEASLLASGRRVGGIVRKEKVTDEIDLLINSFADLVENNEKQAYVLEQIAQGNIDDVDIEVRSEDDALNLSMKKAIDTLNGLKSSLLNFATEFKEGSTFYRADSSSFGGSYKDIMDGVNEVIDILLVQVLDLVAAVGDLGEGRLPEVDVDRPGEYGKAFVQLRSTVESLKMLTTDVQTMVNAAIAQDYSVRADATKYAGEYKALIEGINGTLDMIVKKTTWYGNIIDSIPMPVQVMDNDGNWTFINTAFGNNLRALNIIKGSARQLYGKPCYIEGADINGIAAFEAGKEETEFEFNNHIYRQTMNYLRDAEGEKIGYLGSLQDLTAILRQQEYSDAAAERLERNLSNLAAGNFEFEENNIPRNEYTKELEKTFDKIDHEVERVTQAVGELVEDSVKIANYAVEGRLEQRADLSRYEGEYAKVMKGLNDTVDALTEPVNELIDVLSALGSGDLSKQVTGNYQGDLASSKEAFNNTVQSLREIIGDIKATLSAIGSGDLTIQMRDVYKGDFVEIKNSLTDIIDNLSIVMDNINEASQQVAAGAKQLSDGAQNLAAGSTKQAMAIRELGDTMNGIADQTKHNTEDAKKASDLSKNLMVQADQGNKQMKDMLSSMSEINESSANISKIIKVIDDIAFQTNILALNAAVEAARAGVHGKGFAVVADEVRNLAAKSAAAASETTSLIEGSVAKVNTGTEIANATAAALEKIVSGITETSNLCDVIASVSHKQAAGIDEVNNGLEDISDVVQSNSATSEESAASSEELYGQADSLKSLVAQFKTKSSSQNSDFNAGTRQTLISTSEADTKAQNNSDMPHITLDFEEFDKY